MYSRPGIELWTWLLLQAVPVTNLRMVVFRFLRLRYDGHRMVLDTVKKVPIDHVRAMYANVVLSGGTTLIKGFKNRLLAELKAKLPSNVEIVIKEPLNRHLSAWVGASVLASAKTFNFYWVSREEYDKYGTALVHAPV